MKSYTFYIDQKVTVWERTDYTIDAESYEEALEVANKLFDNRFYSDECDNVSSETDVLCDTMVEIKPEENNNQPTKELISKNWVNNKREEITIKTNVL